MKYFENTYDPQKPVYALDEATGRWKMVYTQGCYAGYISGKIRPGKRRQSFTKEAGFVPMQLVNGQYLPAAA